eukprot:5392077-Prymnesium_polylepis.1
MLRIVRIQSLGGRIAASASRRHSKVHGCEGAGSIAECTGKRRARELSFLAPTTRQVRQVLSYGTPKAQRCGVRTVGVV